MRRDKFATHLPTGRLDRERRRDASEDCSGFEVESVAFRIERAHIISNTRAEEAIADCNEASRFRSSSSGIVRSGHKLEEVGAHIRSRTGQPRDREVRRVNDLNVLQGDRRELRYGYEIPARLHRDTCRNPR